MRSFSSDSNQKDLESSPFNLLHLFSENFSFSSLPPHLQELLIILQHVAEYNTFPAIKNDVGSLLSFLCQLIRPKTIFEFGSGYGQSAFWFLSSESKEIEKIYLTERRENLWDIFESFPWPSDWKKKMDYHCGDAFDKISEVNELDLVLMDGQKGRYLDFFQIIENKLSEKGIVIVDNAFLKGNILELIDLDETAPIKKMSKPSVIGVKKFYRYLTKSKMWKSIFLPFGDGVLLVYRGKSS